MLKSIFKLNKLSSVLDPLEPLNSPDYQQQNVCCKRDTLDVTVMRLSSQVSWSLYDNWYTYNNIEQNTKDTG